MLSGWMTDFSYGRILYALLSVKIYLRLKFLDPVLSTVMILSFWTDRSGQTVQTQIKLQFWLHLLGALLFGKAILFKF